jgi:hypothetical protein
VGLGVLMGLWLLICALIDAPSMLFGGPMQMTVLQCGADIGLTYVAIPLVTWGLALEGAGVPGSPGEPRQGWDTTLAREGKRVSFGRGCPPQPQLEP